MGPGSHAGSKTGRRARGLPSDPQHRGRWSHGLSPQVCPVVQFRKRRVSVWLLGRAEGRGLAVGEPGAPCPVRGHGQVVGSCLTLEARGRTAHRGLFTAFPEVLPLPSETHKGCVPGVARAGTGLCLSPPCGLHKQRGDGRKGAQGKWGLWLGRGLVGGLTGQSLWAAPPFLQVPRAPSPPSLESPGHQAWWGESSWECPDGPCRPPQRR